MYLRKIYLLLCLCILSISSFPAGFTEAQEHSCAYCGIYRSKFGHSWVIITHEDGSSESVCSIHCAAIDMALHPDKNIGKITVGDYDTKKQIDADTAHWVIGGDIMGVMTARAKWAFETKDGADNFIKKHGGRPADFREVIKAAFENMYEDTLMIQKKRKMKRMKKMETTN